MTKLAKPALIVAIFSLALAAAAQTLTGTVTNGTTNKPAAGDEVLLINLANGMDVGGDTHADSAGKFSFKVTVPGPHLIRAIHQGVNYHQMAPPGVNTANVQVYDVATKLAEIGVTADVMRFQSDGGTLQGVRLFVVSNTSSPARTQMNDHNFEFYLPAGAKIEQVQARSPNGQPIPAEAKPDPEKTSDKNRYSLAFPLRPGETQFQVEFTLPYSGEIKIDPKPLYSDAHLVIVLPKTMQFTAATPASFQSMQDPNSPGSMVQVAQQTKPGQPLAFTLKGTGVITESQAEGGGQGQGEAASGSAPQGQPAQAGNRPGGGLGAPIDAPDPLKKYQLWILGIFAVLLAIGGWIVTKRQSATAVAIPPVGLPSASMPSSAAFSAPGAVAPVGPTTTSTNAQPAKSSLLLEALKEELFQLEVEKKQGKISTEDYDKAKAALDQTLDRALKRQS